jgi:DNA-binding SARP family transcriptional activator
MVNRGSTGDRAELMAASKFEFDEDSGGILRIMLLGPPAASLDGRDLRLGPPRQWAVLAVLAARAGVTVARDEIISAVWGAAQPTSAERGVHTYVSGLRRLLEPARQNRQPGQVLVSHDAGYELRVPRHYIDHWEFERHVEQAELCWRREEFESSLEELNSALALWRGPAFSGIPGPFAETEQVRYEELKLGAMERRAEVRLALGRQAEAIPDLQSLIRQQPLRERARLLLIQSLYQSDRQADALAEYQNARRSLIEQLGVEPGEALQALHGQILRGEPLRGHVVDRVVTATPVRREERPVSPSQLPRKTGGLTGRSPELRRLHSLLGPVGHETDPLPIVSITGPAGVGKTSLAVSFAHMVAERFDGHLFVNLHGFDQERMASSAAVVVGGLLAALGVSEAGMPADLDQMVAMYRSVTAAKRLLLVLDNAENATQVRPLLPGGSGSAVIITSRSRLEGLVARDGAHPVVLSPLNAHDSVELLGDVIGRDRVAAEPEAAVRIADLCAGLPLAIRVAAERIATRGHLSLADVAEDLAEESGRLDALTVRGDDETSARTVFSWSYRHLDAEDARAFRLLSLQPAVDFAVGAAAALLDLKTDVAQTRLEALASMHLIEEVRPGRCRFHDLIRLYARELCREQDGQVRQGEAVDRLLRWYLTMAARASAALAPWQDTSHLEQDVPGLQGVQGSDNGLEWFRRESSALTAAVELASESGRVDIAWQMPFAAFHYLHVVKNWRLWAAVYEPALRATHRAGARFGEAWMHHGLSVADHGRGDFDGAYEHSRSALEIRRAIGDRDGEAWSLHGLGLACLGLKRLDKAESYFVESIRLRHELSDRYGGAVSTLFLSQTVQQSGRSADAVKLAEEALAVFTELDSLSGVGHALTVLGSAHKELRNYDLAGRYLRRALQACRDAGDEHGEGDALRGLGGVMSEVGADDQAREYLAKAFMIMQRRGDPQAEEVRVQLGKT